MASKSDMEGLKSVFGDICEEDCKVLIEEFAGKGE